MIAIGCENIEKSYGTDVILSDITFSLNEGEKLGIVGVNGAGKSTLINIICGNITEYGGNVYIAKDSRIGVLAQHTDFESNRSVYGEVLTAFSELLNLEEKLENLQSRMASGDTLAANDYSKLYERYVSLGGLEYKSRARSTLIGLGLTEKMFEMNASTLSGGQKTVLALAKLLLKNYDILILDEPTNHLDFKALDWLEKYLNSYNKTVIIISHDRYFLDNTTTKTLEIQNGKCKMYNGNYTKFVEQKSKDTEIQQKHYDNQQKEIARLRAYIEQQRRWNRERNIIAAESREKAIDRMVLVEAPDKEPENIKLKFAEAPQCANDVLQVFGLSKRYGEKVLFNNVDFLIKNKDRAFLLGDNGTGKSTMMKILMGFVGADKGEFEYGNRVEVAYYDQEYQGLTPENTVLDELYYSAESDISTTKIRTILGSFLFDGDDAFKKVADLSGGEKARLTFAKLILKPSNLLFLDEPTNHLDIGTREVLENALSEYGGTILAVSHDRYFIKKLASRILYLKNGSVSDYKMDYEHFAEYFNSCNTSDSNTSYSEKTSNKEDYLNEKKKRSDILKKKTRYQRLTQEIENTELKKAQIEDLMSTPEIAADYVKIGELSKESEELDKLLNEYYGEWEALDNELKDL